MPPDVGLCRQRPDNARGVPKSIVRSLMCPPPAADDPGGHAALHIPAYRSLTLNCLLIAGWMAARMTRGINPLCLRKKKMDTLTNIDRLASAHPVLLVFISRQTSATRSRVHFRRRVVHISSRHLPWCCSLPLSSLGALVCHATERLSLACHEKHLIRLSSSQASLNAVPDPSMGSQVGLQACLLKCASRALTKCARATSHTDDVQWCTT